MGAGGHVPVCMPGIGAQQQVFRHVHAERAAHAVRRHGLHGDAHVVHIGARIGGSGHKRVEDQGNHVRMLVAVQVQGLFLVGEGGKEQHDLRIAFTTNLLSGLCAAQPHKAQEVVLEGAALVHQKRHVLGARHGRALH